MRALLLAAAVAAALCAVGAAAGAPQSELSVSVVGAQASPWSATVRWRVSRTASVVVEYGLDGSYGAWSRRVDAGASLSGKTGLTGLEPARSYRFRVVARARGARVEATGTLTTAPEPSWVGAVVTSRNLAVGGQPFFPRMAWAQCPWAYPLSLAAGVNLFMGTCGTTAEQLADLRGRALSVTPADTRVDGPGVIGYYQPDEADATVGRPEDLPLLPPSKTSHRVTFLTLTNHFFSGSAPPANGRGIYPPLIARAEMIGFSLYPLQSWCRRATLGAVFDAQRELVSLANGKPTYQWIEANRMEFCAGLDPSPALVRAETWLAIAGGARGIGWFPGVWTPSVQEAITELSSAIASLAPGLLGEDGVAQVAPAGSPVRAGVRRANGATYVLAVNSWTDPVRVRIHVPGLTAGSVAVFGENRSLPVKNGTISDGFRGLQARIYVAAPPWG